MADGAARRPPVTGWFPRWLALPALALMGACAPASTPAPDYQARLLGSEDTVSLASLRGRAVLLNVWATWCIPCREEMPAFQRLHEVYADRGLAIVGVNIDEGQGDGEVEAFARDLGITFAIWRDPNARFQKRFRTLGVPETILVDRSGAVVHHWFGPIDPNQADNLKLIQRALGAPPPGNRPNAVTAAGAADSVRVGRRLAEQRGCFRCHSLDGESLEGPTWQGIAGAEVRLVDGRTVVRDRAYLIRAIAEPDAEVVAGYPRGLMAGAMPGRALAPAEVEALVSFIGSLRAGR